MKEKGYGLAIVDGGHLIGNLENYKLLFKGTPGNAYATIEPDEGREVPVLV